MVDVWVGEAEAEQTEQVFEPIATVTVIVRREERGANSFLACPFSPA